MGNKCLKPVNMETETDSDMEQWNVGASERKAVKESDSNVSSGGKGGGRRKSTDQPTGGHSNTDPEAATASE